MDSRAVGERSIARSGQRTTIAAGALRVASSRVQPSSFIAANEPDTIPPTGGDAGDQDTGRARDRQQLGVEVHGEVGARLRVDLSQLGRVHRRAD
jgi:hypothetical protein